MAGVKGRSGVYIRTESTRKAHTKHRVCEVERCNNKHWAKGLCRKHWSKQYRKTHKEYIFKWIQQWQQDNKEHRGEYHKQYRKDNKEHLIEYDKQYRKDNKKELAEYVKQYFQAPAGKAIAKAANHNHRALTKDLTTAIIQRVYEDNIAKYGRLTCYLCGKPIVFGDERLKDSLDHSTPLTRQGSNDYENLGIAHKSCNSKKYTKTLEEWFLITKEDAR